MSYKPLFSKFLAADPERLHFAAHSHHLWPDVSLDAHVQAWHDAATHVDRKWGTIFGEVLPEMRGHIARVLQLPDASTIAVAPNTHELVVRILSCFGNDPIRVLTTDSEFHSFERQSRRLEEAGSMQVTRIATEPFETFDVRFLDAVRQGGHDLVYVSHVFFNSGFEFKRYQELAKAVPSAETFIVIDAYHGFLALPTDLSRVADRFFYLSGGYKYVMSGEGACFAHCPNGFGERPVNTGWFAGFGALEKGVGDGVGYASDGSRFQGSTIEPTPFYRFNAVMRLLQQHGLTVEKIHEHVGQLQTAFLDRLRLRQSDRLPVEALTPALSHSTRGHFLTFRLPDAGELHAELLDANVITDYRGDRLRFGIGIYHDVEDIDSLIERLP